MKLDTNVIGIGGNARSGKDTLADNLVEILKDLGIKSQKVSFAHALKSSVDDFLLRELGISAFTENSDEKQIIRPFLVCWGTNVMRSRNPKVWIEKLHSFLKEDEINIISDMRFENEHEWIKEVGGRTILIKRPGLKPANIYEEQENQKLSGLVDLKFGMANLSDEEMIKGLSYEILNSLLTEEILETWKATCPS